MINFESLKTAKSGIYEINGINFKSLYSEINKYGGSTQQGYASILVSETPYRHISVRKFTNSCGRTTGFVATVDAD